MIMQNSESMMLSASACTSAIAFQYRPNGGLRRRCGFMPVNFRRRFAVDQSTPVPNRDRPRSNRTSANTDLTA